jgi:hypothetical protein
MYVQSPWHGGYWYRWWDTPAVNYPSGSPSASWVSNADADKSPYLLVPDGKGGYREHRPTPPRRKLGF